MNMITDDELLLYYYRDGLDAGDRARIGAALAGQPELAQRLHRLVARLDAASTAPEVPVPAKIQQRWQAALDGAIRGESRATPATRRFTQPRWLAAAAVLGAVALAVTFQVLQPEPARIADDQTTDQTTAPAQPAAPQGGASYEKGLKFHLASTERQLVALGEASPEERARLIETIIGQNRLYALAAERAGEPQLARVLRAFSPILEDVAAGRSQSTAGSLAQLSFEMRVMQARLNAGAAPHDTL